MIQDSMMCIAQTVWTPFLAQVMLKFSMTSHPKANPGHSHRADAAAHNPSTLPDQAEDRKVVLYVNAD